MPDRKDEPGDEFERFKSLTGRLLRVPKREIDDKVKAAKRPRPKPSR